MNNETLTKNQALVLAVLEKNREPVSAYQILDQLRGDGLRAPLQVYRALDKLLEFGRVHRLECMNAFVACAHPHHQHGNHGTIAFAICETCGAVAEFHDEVVDERLARWEKNAKFRPDKTTIEIRGRCQACV